MSFYRFIFPPFTRCFGIEQCDVFNLNGRANQYREHATSTTIFILSSHSIVTCRASIWLVIIKTNTSVTPYSTNKRKSGFTESFESLLKLSSHWALTLKCKTVSIILNDQSKQKYHFKNIFYDMTCSHGNDFIFKTFTSKIQKFNSFVSFATIISDISNYMV